MLLYNLRHFYLAIGACFTFFGMCRAYAFTFEVEHIYEDALDNKFFQYVKSQGGRGILKVDINDKQPGAFWTQTSEAPEIYGQYPSINFLVSNMYKSDLYSVEGRSS